MKHRWDHAPLKFPLTKKQVSDGKTAKCHSAILQKDKRVLVDPKDMPVQYQPEDGAEFWSEVLEVALAVKEAQKKTQFSKLSPELKDYINAASHIQGDFLATVIRKEYRINTAYDLAMLVRADWPTDIMNKLAAWLYSQGYKEREFFDYKYIRFTDGVVFLASLIGQLIHSISPTAFAHKYYHGKMRPNMAVHKWAKGDIDISNGLDMALTKLVNKRAIARDQNEFGIYPPPPHPALPAMHSSVASIHILMAVWFDLDKRGFNECKKVAYNIAYGRTFGGVHYRSDNLYGLELGERSSAIILPKLLSNYGIDESEVSDIISQYRTDWFS